MATSCLAGVCKYGGSSGGRGFLCRPSHVLRTAPLLLQCCRYHNPAPAKPAEEAPLSDTPAATEGLRPYSEIPGPPYVPVLKHFPAFLPGGRYFNVSAIEQLTRLRQDYGPMVRLEIPGKRRALMLYEPSATQAMLQADGKIPIRGEFAAYIKYRTSLGIGVGIAAAEGEQWRQYRELGQRVLGGPQSAMKYLAQNTRTADMLVKHIRKVRDEHNVVKAVQEHAKRWSFESMNVMALGYPVGIFEDDDKARRLFDASIDLFECFTLVEQGLPLWKIMNTSTYKRMGRAVDTIWEVCSGYVSRALDNPVAGSMIAQVSPDITSDQQRVMVTDVFSDLLFASIDTTSTTLTYLLHCLATNPEKQELAREEVLSFLPQPDSQLTPQIINKLSYVKSCLKEALRMHHVAAGVGRVLSRDVVIGGYRVPAGVKCIALGCVMSRDPAHFHAPDTFLPERWVRGSPHYTTGSQWTYLPFGHGPRMCIGRRFAELETWVAAAQLLRNFRVTTETPHFQQVMKLINVPDRPIDIAFTDLD